MAINSYGYPPLISPGSVFARMMQYAGHRYSVAGFSDFRVTISGSGTRRVNIAAGWATGKAVQVQNTATATLDLAAPSGTTQWFLVGLKRWAANPAYDPEAVPGTPESSPYISQLVSVAGNASRLVPTVTQDAGSDDTQWLALCRVISSATAVQEVIDLRLISGEGGGYTVNSDLAMDQLNDIVGARVYRADTLGGHTPTFYERIVNGAGALSWQNFSIPDTELSGLDAINAADGSGWGRSSSSKMVRLGKHRSLIAELTRGAGEDGGAFTSNSLGGLGDQLIAELHSTDRPPSGVAVPLVGRVRLEGGATYGCFGHITSAGGVYLNSMLPNVTVSPGDAVILAGEWYR